MQAMFLRFFAPILCSRLLCPAQGQDLLSAAEPPFIPDSVLAGIHLCDAASAVVVIGAVPPDSLIDDRKDMPRVYFFNADSTEILTAYFHYGDGQGAYSELLVTTAFSGPIRSGLPIKRFVSGRGIALGMSEKEVRKIFGEPGHWGQRTDNSVDLTYSMRDPSALGYLQRCNSPVYYARFSFSDEDRLIGYRFGFEYP